LGLTNSESNHGEDVKEYYFYLDSTPTHSYMKHLYKYPQAAYPYSDLVETSRRRGRDEFEYELLDTGVFDQDRYFDVFVEYAKAAAEDLLIQVTVHNRGPEPAELPLLPTLWFRHQRPRGGALDRASPPQIRPHPGGQRRQGRGGQAGRALPLLRRRGVPALHGERDQHAAHLRRAQPQPLRQGWHQQPRRPRSGRGGEPGQERDEGGGALLPHGGSWRFRGDPPPVVPFGAGGPGRGKWRRRQSLRHRPRGGGGGTAERGRRVLRRPDAALPGRRRGQRLASGAGGDALEQAVLLLRRGQMARGARLRPLQADAQGGAAQRAVAPHVQRRRDLHAGQVGVPLVCRLGPGLPCRRPDAGRSGLRQAAAA